MAQGENPAPFVVPDNLTGNRVGAIRMWQTRLSFAVGFLLSAGGSIAVAETAIQAGQVRQPLSVAEFAKLVDNDVAVVSTPDVPAPVQAHNLTHEQGDAPVRQTGERRVFSLVGFVEKATAQGAAGEVPRVSLVDLVTDAADPEAEAMAGPVSIEPIQSPEKIATPVPAPVVETDSHASDAGVVAPTVRPVSPQVVVARQAEAVESQIATVASSNAQPIAEPRGLAGSVEPARRSDEGVSAVSLAELTANTSSAEQASFGLPPSAAGDVASTQESLSFAPLALTAFDAKPGKLQLFEAVRSALNEHPAIAESLGRLDAQQEQVEVARAGYWPQLRTGINTGYRHTTGRSEEALTLSASQMLYDFGKVSSAVEAAASGVDREEASVLLAAEDLIRETTQAFIEARRYEELLELATEQIKAIAELEELATKRSALGASSVSDQMQAQSRREAARAVQLQMQAQRDQWHSALEKLIGSSQRLTLDEAYPEPLEGLCPRLPENFENAPRIVVAEAERAEAEAAIRQARAEQRPTLSLNADFEHYLNRDTGTAQQLDDQELVVSLNLTSNLFQGGALRARSRAAEHALQSASAARDRALLELSRFYREARDRSRSLTTSLALQDERYDSIVKTQELYRHQYLSLGTRTLLDILNTEQEIFQTQVDKQNTLFDLRSLQIDCLYSVGGLRDTFRAGDALNHRVLSRRAEVGS